jgi:hypothetical protein
MRIWMLGKPNLPVPICPQTMAINKKTITSTIKINIIKRE